MGHLWMSYGFVNHGAEIGAARPIPPRPAASCSGTIPEWMIGPFLDFTMTGRFDADGQKITGGTRGSGFHGEPFSLVKE